MDFISLIRQRRSTRKFEEREVSEETINRILEVTLTAPSSRNSETTRIAVTSDARIMEIVAGMRDYGSSFVKDAPLAFFIMAEKDSSDLWRENCAISATVLQLAAENEGLATCWVHVNGRRQAHEDPLSGMATDYLQEKVPQLRGYDILCVVAAGYPEKRHRPHEFALDQDKIKRF